MAGNRNLLLNKGFGAFATARDDRKQRQREEEVATELKANKEAALQGCECAPMGLMSCDSVTL